MKIKTEIWNSQERNSKVYNLLTTYMIIQSLAATGYLISPKLTITLVLIQIGALALAITSYKKWQKEEITT